MTRLRACEKRKFARDEVDGMRVASLASRHWVSRVFSVYETRQDGDGDGAAACLAWAWDWANRSDSGPQTGGREARKAKKRMKWRLASRGGPPEAHRLTLGAAKAAAA